MYTGNSKDIPLEVSRRRKLADLYFDNYREYSKKKMFQKASEFLWGALNSLVYALSLAIYGEKVRRHSEVKDKINKLAADLNDPELAELFKASAEILHANFYHDFLDEDSFKYHAKNMEKLLGKLASILDKRAQKSAR